MWFPSAFIGPVSRVRLGYLIIPVIWMEHDFLGVTRMPFRFTLGTRESDPC